MKVDCSLCDCALNSNHGMIVVLVPVFIDDDWVTKYLCRTCFLAVDALPYADWETRMKEGSE